MKSYHSGLFFSALVFALFAVSPGVASAEEDPGVLAVEKADASPSRSTVLSSSSIRASDSIRQELKKLGLSQGSQLGPTGMTIIQMSEASMTVDPLAEDFMLIRDLLAVEAGLAAKRSIIESISTDADAIQSVSREDDSAVKQFQIAQGKYDKAIALRERQLKAAKEETAALLRGVDDAQADVIQGATVGDRFMELLEAGIKKLDESYDPNQLDEKKKKRLSDLKLSYERAKEMEDRAAQLKEEIEQEKARLVGSVQKQVKSNVSVSSSYPLFGATALRTADYYNELTGEMQVAVALVWSQKLEKEARDVYTKKGGGPARPGKLSLSDWLDKQDLEVMIGPRRYIDGKGQYNFLGISAVEVPSDPGLKSDALSAAELYAKQAALLSLKAEATSYRSGQRLGVNRVGADGKISPEVFRAQASNMQQEVKVSNFGGLETVTTRELIHPSSGRLIYVSVANINSTLAQMSDELMKDSYALLKEANALDSQRQGQKQGMMQAAEETRNNQGLIQEGKSDGAKAVNSEYQKNVDERAARNSMKEKSPAPAASVSGSERSGGNVQSGTFMNRGTIERDF